MLKLWSCCWRELRKVSGYPLGTLLVEEKREKFRGVFRIESFQELKFTNLQKSIYKFKKKFKK